MIIVFLRVFHVLTREEKQDDVFILIDNFVNEVMFLDQWHSQALLQFIVDSCITHKSILFLHMLWNPCHEQIRVECAFDPVEDMVLD